MQNQEQERDRLTGDDVPRIRSQPRRKKRRVSKYEDEATTDDEEGIEEEGLELPVKDGKNMEKGEEKMGGGKIPWRPYEQTNMVIRKLSNYRFKYHHQATETVYNICYET